MFHRAVVRTFCGLAAGLAVPLLVPPGDPLTVAVDDSLFRRSGRKVHGAGWQHDGSSPSQDRISFGTCFVTCGIVVHLPFCTRPVCLPVLARLVLPGAGARTRRRNSKKAVPVPGTKVTAATSLVTLLACTLIITWYARHGHHRAGITARRHAQPWYQSKTEPAFEDMLTQLRRVLITARISKGSAAHPTPEQTKDVLAAWQAAAA